MVIKSELNSDKVGCVDFICLYIISTHYGTYYTGITNNLIRRWYEHISGKSSYLSKFKSKEVVYVKFYESRREAAKKERMIKNIGARKFLLRLEFRK
jgi:predicted GIY-YIG superfamily endonuclease